MTAVTRYRLSLASHLEPFRPEIEYACDFVDRAHFVERVPEADRVLHYGADPPPGAVVVPNALFPNAVRLDADGIHPRHEVLDALAAGRGAVRLLPADQADRRSAAYDALAVIFMYLSRLEERGSSALDRYGRFPFASSITARFGRAGFPMADAAARDLAAAISGTMTPSNRSRYEILPTHDVDRLRGYHYPLQPLRHALGDIIRRGGNWRAAWGRLRRGYLAGEPFRSIRHLMTVAERHHRQAYFFFMGPTRHPMDSPYALDMVPLLRTIALEITARNHQIGFHPGYLTSANPEEWHIQKAGLEAILGRGVTIGRQHVLRYDAAATPDIWDENGMVLDATLNYPETMDFRPGTCRRFNAYSLRKRRKLGLEQVATPLMDTGVFDGKYRNLTVEEALREIEPLLAVCREFGGTFVVLHHAGEMDAPKLPFFERLMQQV